MELIKQEVSAERYIDIPDEVLDSLQDLSPLSSFQGCEPWKSIGTKSKIYYKYEVEIIQALIKPTQQSPAYYNKKEESGE